MPFHRSALAALAAAAAVLTLTACEKPAPSITAFSGTTSAHQEAICWSFESDRQAETSDCAVDLEAQEPGEVARTLLEEIAIIPATPGETVGISVDPVVAESGWLVTLNGRPLTREPVTEKYFRFTMAPQPLRGGDAQLVVQALTDDGAEVRGSWIFGLSDGRDAS
jgi:hypothetical protein